MNPTRLLQLLVTVTITLLVSGCTSSTPIPIAPAQTMPPTSATNVAAPTSTQATEPQPVSKAMDVAIDVVIGLIGAGLGGFITHLWERRRTSDKELFLILRGAFDRPAFKGPYTWHSDHQAFQEAIATTLKAVKTGKRMNSRDQDDFHVEGRYYGPFAIHDPQRRKAMQDVEDRLQRVFQLSGGIANLPERSEDTRVQIDHNRDEIIRMLNTIWKGLGIPEMRIPTEVKLYDEVYDLRT